MTRFRFAASVALIALAGPPAFAANSASGSFRYDKVTLRVKHACAILVPEDGDPAKRRTLLYLSDKPLDCAAADAALDPEEVLDGQVRSAKAGSVRIPILPGGEAGTLYFSNTEPSESFNSGGIGKLTLKTNSEARLEGSYATDKPEDFFDKTYEFKLTFAADVTKGPVTGTPLPAGGGEAGKAYLAYAAAVAKRDYAKIKALVSAERAAKIFENEGTDWFKDTFEWFRNSQPASAKVVAGLANGDRVTLTVEGKSYDDKDAKIKGRVRMVKDAKGWKITEEDLSTAY